MSEGLARIKIDSALLAVLLVMSLAAPGFARIDYFVRYELDGTVDFKSQAGHYCNTGAEQKQTITGDGEISKTSTIVMIPGRLTVQTRAPTVRVDNCIPAMITGTA